MLAEQTLWQVKKGKTNLNFILAWTTPYKNKRTRKKKKQTQKKVSSHHEIAYFVKSS